MSNQKKSIYQENIADPEIKNKIKEVVFAPGCFDDFNGTQEELDSLVAEIHKAIESGDFLKNSQPLDEADLELLAARCPGLLVDIEDIDDDEQIDIEGFNASHVVSGNTRH